MSSNNLNLPNIVYKERPRVPILHGSNDNKLENERHKLLSSNFTKINNDMEILLNDVNSQLQESLEKQMDKMDTMLENMNEANKDTSLDIQNRFEKIVFIINNISNKVDDVYSIKENMKILLKNQQIYMQKQKQQDKLIKSIQKTLSNTTNHKTLLNLTNSIYKKLSEYEIENLSEMDPNDHNHDDNDESCSSCSEEHDSDQELDHDSEESIHELLEQNPNNDFVPEIEFKSLLGSSSVKVCDKQITYSRQDYSDQLDMDKQEEQLDMERQEEQKHDLSSELEKLWNDM